MRPRRTSPAANSPAVGALLLWAAFAASCGPSTGDAEGTIDRDGPAWDQPVEDDEAARAEAPGSASDAARESQAARRESLRALAELGYAGFADSEAARAPGRGVVVHDRDRAWPGCNLVTSIPSASAQLVDNDGVVLHAWTSDWNEWSRVRLMPDGGLLVVGSTSEGWRLTRLDRDGHAVWPHPLVDAHHDVRLLADGRVLALVRDTRSDTDYAPRRLARDNTLVLLDADTGAVLRKLSLLDALRGRAGLELLGPDDVPASRFGVLDPLHCNSVFPIDGPGPAEHDARFAPGRVLVSSRHQSLVFLVDLESGRWDACDVAWHFGPGTLQLQHEASVLDDGHVLLFDNGTEQRGFSRLLEIDPLDGEVVWSYTATPPESFFSPGRGTVQRLPNDDLLVADSAAGSAFEVTRGGDVVWRYLNPDTDDSGSHGALRIERLPLDALPPEAR